MFSDFKYVIAYTTGVLTILLAYSVSKRNLNTLSFFLLVWWSISAVASCSFFWFYFPMLDPLHPEAFIFYFIGVIVILSPLFKFNENEIELIETSPYLPMINKFSIFLGTLSLLPLIENVIFVFSHNSLDFVLDQHDALNSGNYQTHLSFISEKLHNFTAHFADIFGLLICALMLKWKRYKVGIYAISVAISEQVLNCVANGLRGSIVYLAILIAIAYKIFYNQFPKRVRQKTNKIVIIGIGSLSVLLLALTGARTSNMDTTYMNATDNQIQLASNSLYLGEAPVRFSSYAWGIKSYTDGHTLFDEVVSKFDGIQFKNSVQRRNWTQQKTGIKYPQVFYGFVGFSYIDFGIAGIIVLLLFRYIFLQMIRKIRRISFAKLIPIIIWIKILVFSTMVFPYFYSKFYDLLYMAVLYLILQHTKVIRNEQ